MAPEDFGGGQPPEVVPKACGHCKHRYILSVGIYSFNSEKPWLSVVSTYVGSPGFILIHTV